VQAYPQAQRTTAGSVTRKVELSRFGAKGPRVIYAIRSLNGTQIEKFKVAEYVAAGPPTVPAPGAVKVRRASPRTLEVCWTPVSEATRYEITTDVSDRRKLLQTFPKQSVVGGGLVGGPRPRSTGRLCITEPGIDTSVGASARVRAFTAYGQSPQSKAAGLGRVKPTSTRVVLR
jgi:hypothetical protein